MYICTAITIGKVNFKICDPTGNKEKINSF